MITKPKTGGEVLLKKHGKGYFKKLATNGWKTRRKKIKEYEASKSKKAS